MAVLITMISEVESNQRLFPLMFTLTPPFRVLFMTRGSHDCFPRKQRVRNYTPPKLPDQVLPDESFVLHGAFLTFTLTNISYRETAPRQRSP